MEMWTNLGIEKTKDIEAITNAYHEKLKYVHPEEKPEEFMALRAEYEEAMKYAQQTEETEEKEKTPIDLWVEKVEAVYNELSRRIDINEWQTLLKDDVCQGLDTRVDARNAFLRSTMNNSALPQKVWQLLEEEFSFKENKEELYEIFPKDYIDNCVISGAENPPVVPYELFAEGTVGNPDCYFDLHYKARNEIRNKDADSAEATVADIEKTGFVHPYTDVLKARIALCRDEYDKALEIIEPLCEKYPEDTGIRGARGDILYCAERFEEAVADYDFILSKGVKASRYIHAQCLMQAGEYVKAKDMLIDLMTEYPFEEAFKKAFDEACQKVNESYEQKLSEGTLSVKETLEYAWGCLQSDKAQRAKELTDNLITDDIAEKCDLLNIQSKLHINTSDYETALKCADEWEKAVGELPEGETEEEKKRKNKLYDIYYVQAMALSELGRYDEALSKAALSIELSNDRASECHNLRRYILRSQKKDFIGALHEAEKMAEVKSGSWPYYVLGIEQYELGRLQDSFNSFGESLQYTLELDCYIYRIRILCDVGQYDGAQEIIEFLEGHNIDTDSLRYCKARILEGKEEKEEALKIYYSIIENLEKNQSDINFGYDVYYRAAELDTKKSNEDRLKLVDDGLKIRANCYDLLYLKTTLLENMRKYSEALEVYNKIEEEYPGRYNLNNAIAGNYYDMGDYETALEHYQKYLETRESAGLRDMMGLCLLYLGRIDEAREQFEKAVELDGENVRFRTNLGMSYEYKFDFDTAAEIHAKNSELNDSKEEKERRIYVNRALARAHARAGRYDEAEKAYLKNLEMFGKENDARFVIEICIESKQLEKAQQYIEKYKAENKIDDGQYLLMMADIRRLQEEHKEYFKLINKLDKDSVNRYTRLGRYYLHDGKLKKAQEYFDELEKKAPDRVDYFNDRLYTLRKLGKQDEADKLLAHALEVLNDRKWDGDEQTLYVTKLALVHTAAGHPEKAKEYIDKALKMPLCEHCRYGKCKDAYLALAEYYENLGEYDKAIETCREGLKLALDEYDFVYIMRRIQKEHKKELKKENKK